MNDNEVKRRHLERFYQALDRRHKEYQSNLSAALADKSNLAVIAQESRITRLIHANLALTGVLICALIYKKRNVIFGSGQNKINKEHLNE